MSEQLSPLSRRQFIGQAACAGVGLTSLLSTMGTLRLFNATLAAQGTPTDDYKAIICLFLYGGNDGNNIVVPFDTAGYDAYAAARGTLALPREELLALTDPTGDGRQFAVHSSFNRLKELYDGQKMAFLANVGTLVAPITKAEYRSGGAAIPPYLFSHNDQQVQWQTSVPDSSRKIGWGGRLADLVHELNGADKISMNISVAGNNFFQVGNDVFQYHISTGGSVGLTEFRSNSVPRKQQYQGLNEAFGMSYSHLFENEYARITNRAVANDTLVSTTLATTPRFDRASTATGAGPNDQNLFPNSARNASGALVGVAAQLHMILRIIYAREALGMKRQIFFSSLGGFDTHDDQINDQAVLLTQLNNAVYDFYKATETLGFADKATIFTASDFNRTFSSNGKGSDHAWGSHHFVVGGAVKGGRVYGSMPILQTGGPDDTGNRGAWIPTTSTDEFASTLARWFGVSAADMPLVLPNIGRFARPDLGFMNLA